MLKHIGAYFLMIRLVFIKPTKRSIIYGLVLKEIQDLILGSLGIVCFLSFFVGGVVSIQTALNIDSAFIPENLVMGINSVNFLIFPKLLAMTLLPIVIIFSMFLGIFGGWAATIYGGFSSSASFIQGIQMEFNSFHVVYAFVKTFLFAFILATIPSYHGYYMKGGALDVGRASTVSFVWCSVVIIVVNYFVTQFFFS